MDEGIAKILETSVGGGSVPAPPADSVDAIYEDHCGERREGRRVIGSFDEAARCAHAVGNLVHEMFEELETHRGESYARARYMEAVVALRGDISVSVGDFHLQVGREIVSSENNMQFPENEAAALTEGDFSLADLRQLLDLLGVRRMDRDIRPDYIPH